MPTPRFGLLFHFTHVDNLPAVLEAGELLADTELAQHGTLTCEAGHQSIKQRRRHKEVTCRPGGVVGDYVPFYFAARSPMMFTIALFRAHGRDIPHRVRPEWYYT